jgi:hypothetical protein
MRARRPLVMLGLAVVGVTAGIVLGVTLMGVVGSPTETPRPTAVPTKPSSTPTPTPTNSPLLVIDPAAQTFPAGSSVQFAIRADQTGDSSGYSYWVEDLPAGVTADFLYSAAPYEKTLILHTAGSLPVGQYAVTIWATVGRSQPVASHVTLDVTSCTEFQPGEFTQSIQSNLITLITAGKPYYEEGLLVPVQVCGRDQVRQIRVTLETAVSEAGTMMATPPRFCIYRCLVWPAPTGIDTHTAWAVNATGRVDSTGWELDGKATAGLYLLVFERNRYPPTSDPERIPASVTYRLEIVP